MPGFGRAGDAVDQFGESHEGVRAIEFLAAVGLRFDDDRTLSGDAGVLQREQPHFYIGWQARIRDVKAQVDRAGDFVDVLSASTLRPHRGHIDF